MTTGATIFTEVNRTGPGTVSGSVIDLSNSSSAVFNLGTSGNMIGLGTGNAINIVVNDTNNSLLTSDGSYTIALAKAQAGNFSLNGTPLANTGIVLIDQGTSVATTPGTGGGLGALGYATVTVEGNTNGFAGAVTSWTLELATNGGIQTLELALSTGTATPEPHHLLLFCAGALLLGAAARRRLSGWGNRKIVEV